MSAEVAAYFCPMCEGVEATEPGPCPHCGMALESRDGDPSAASDELVDMRRRFWVSTCFAVPILYVAMIDRAVGAPLAGRIGADAMGWLQLALAIPPVFYGGAPLFGRAWASVRSGHWNMFTLIGLGTGTAFVASLVALLAPDLVPATFRLPSGAPPLFFEAAAVIVTLVLWGQVLELRARARTGDALRALLDLVPNEATRIAADGSDEIVPICHVDIGDRLRVRPGERVPVDGTILEGASALDESMMTGESLPVPRGAGDTVLGGTMNGTGSFVFEATGVGDDTLVARIAAQVAAAQASRAPAQRLADQVSAVFVPAVVAIAALAIAAWALFGPPPALAHGLAAAVAVLIIACPCALGLATPMAVTVGMGRGARDGLLFRDAEALEQLREIDVLVVDKTGTLTEGRPELAMVLADQRHADGELLRLAASLERSSEHPLAAAIVRAARDRGATLAEASDFAAEPGLGAGAKVDGRLCFVGSERALRERGVDVEPFEREAALHEREGRSVVWVEVDGHASGLLVLEDRVKESTPEALDALRAAGVRIVMASGDAATTAQAVARRLGIDEVHAPVLPEDKRALVERFRSEGERVAMAGDGVNDGPALAAADVGIAMSSGSELAIDAAAVTLVNGDLRGIVRALRLGKATLRTIRQNLGFAFAYNALGVPIAAGALYPLLGWTLPPMFGAAAMSLSSVSVIANALRLSRQRL